MRALPVHARFTPVTWADGLSNLLAGLSYAVLFEDGPSGRRRAVVFASPPATERFARVAAWNTEAATSVMHEVRARMIAAIHEPWPVYDPPAQDERIPVSPNATTRGRPMTLADIRTEAPALPGSLTSAAVPVTPPTPAYPRGRSLADVEQAGGWPERVLLEDRRLVPLLPPRAPGERGMTLGDLLDAGHDWPTWSPSDAGAPRTD